jgi:hypothetical protein
MDLTKLSDDELDQLRRDVLAEQERRENLARIPHQITELRDKYVELGGDPEQLD